MCRLSTTFCDFTLAIGPTKCLFIVGPPWCTLAYAPSSAASGKSATVVSVHSHQLQVEQQRLVDHALSVCESIIHES